MKKYFILFFISFLIIKINCEENSVTINRKVVILPFYNNSKFIQNDYLSRLIYDSLLYSLNDTKKFLIINENFLISKLGENFFKTYTNKIVNEEEVYKIGSYLGADVIVFGYYDINLNKIKIYSNAYDIGAKQTAISLDTSSKVNIEIFDVIDEAAKNLSQKMNEKLPPYQNIMKISNQIAVLKFLENGIEKEKSDEVRKELVEKIVNQKIYKLVESGKVDMITQEIKIDNKQDYTKDEIIQIGAQLEAEKIITGNVEKNYGNITIKVKLINADNGDELLSKKVILSDEKEIPKALDYLALAICDSLKLKESKDKDFVKYNKQNEIEIIDTDNNNIKNIILPVEYQIKNAGYGLFIAGTVTALSGTAIFIFDRLYFQQKIYDYEKSDSINRYNDYQNLYSLNLNYFIIGTSLMGLGVCLIIPSIPLMSYKDKNKLSLEINVGKIFGFELRYKFD